MTASERRLAANPDSYGATHALERLAVATQDAEAVVSLLGGDLSSVCQYLRVAEAMVEMGRDEDALEWARRGLEGGGTARALLRRADRRNYEEAMPWLRRMRCTPVIGDNVARY